MNKVYEDIGYEKPFQWSSALISKYLKNNNIKELEKLDEIENTAFMTACLIKSDLALNFLRYKKIDFNAQNEKGNTALMLACWANNTDIILPLLKCSKIDRNVKNDEGWTAWDITKKYNPSIFEIYKSVVEKEKMNDIFETDSKKQKKRITL